LQGWEADIPRLAAWFHKRQDSGAPDAVIKRQREALNGFPGEGEKY
jgi:hypothetical protein